MGILSGFVKIAKYGYRYVKYGKQVGKTAKNGSKTYKRGGTLTGLDEKGNVIGQVKKVKTGKYQETHYTKRPIPFTDRYKKTELKISESKSGTNYFKSDRTSYFDNEKGDAVWVSIFKNRKTGVISGNGEYHDGKYGKYYKEFK